MDSSNAFTPCATILAFGHSIFAPVAHPPQPLIWTALVPEHLCSTLLWPESLQELVEANPVERAVLCTRAAGVEEVFAVRRDVLPPAMSEAVIDLWPQAYRHTPCRIRLAERNVEFTLTGLRLLCADDHVGLIVRYRKSSFLNEQTAGSSGLAEADGRKVSE
jgi:hypothetical protein